MMVVRLIAHLYAVHMLPNLFLSENLDSQHITNHTLKAFVTIELTLHYYPQILQSSSADTC